MMIATIRVATRATPKRHVSFTLCTSVPPVVSPCLRSTREYGNSLRALAALHALLSYLRVPLAIFAFQAFRKPEEPRA